MRIAVIGAGAVGCYFGGMLARCGHDVTLVGRARHVDAIGRAGLLMETSTFRERVRVGATTDLAAVASAELVLCCVKSPDTHATGIAIGPLLAPTSTLVSLQNGVDNAVRLQVASGRPALAAVVHVAVEMVAPGHLRHRGRGELTLADGPEARRIAEVLRAAHVPVHLLDDVAGAQWRKLVVNCAFNALSAIAQRPFGPLLQAQGVDALVREIVRECLAVAAAEGVRLDGDPWEALRRTGSQSEQSSSMAHDLALGRRTEIDHLNGYVVRRGDALGVPTPVNRCLQVVVRLIESRAGVAPPGSLRSSAPRPPATPPR